MLELVRSSELPAKIRTKLQTHARNVAHRAARSFAAANRETKGLSGFDADRGADEDDNGDAIAAAAGVYDDIGGDGEAREGADSKSEASIRAALTVLVGAYYGELNKKLSPTHAFTTITC